MPKVPLNSVCLRSQEITPGTGQHCSSVTFGKNFPTSGCLRWKRGVGHLLSNRNSCPLSGINSVPCVIKCFIDISCNLICRSTLQGGVYSISEVQRFFQQCQYELDLSCHLSTPDNAQLMLFLFRLCIFKILWIQK